MNQQRTVFFVSDRTGITAETLGSSLICQFDNIDFDQITVPFVDSPEKAAQAVERINESARRTKRSPLVFSTLINAEIRRLVASAECIFFDFFDIFIDNLEKELGVPCSHTVGRSHGVLDLARYTCRMEAVNFAMGADDGADTRTYSRADVIIVGVSRSGKTPTCLYLALRYGVHSANYPLTEEDLDFPRLPSVLVPYRHLLYGLTISPERLHEIRSKRWAKSRYASVRQCQREIRQAEDLYREQAISFLNTSLMSVEEIAANILYALDLARRSPH